jgi:hypothetical protein
LTTTERQVQVSAPECCEDYLTLRSRDLAGDTAAQEPQGRGQVLNDSEG